MMRCHRVLARWEWNCSHVVRWPIRFDPTDELLGHILYEYFEGPTSAILITMALQHGLAIIMQPRLQDVVCEQYVLHDAIAH